MKIFYHGDMDGICSANILAQSIITDIKKFKIKTEYYEFEYGKVYKYNKIISTKDEEIYFVDCSPEKEILDVCIKQARRVTVIDHHITRQEELEEYYKENKIDGIFYNGVCATLLTYLYVTKILTNEMTITELKDYLYWFSSSKENQNKSNIPLSLKLINSWDVWNKLYIDAEPFKLAFDSYNYEPVNKDLQNFLFDNNRIQNEVRKGNMMKQQITSWSRTFMKRFGYPIHYQGKSIFVANLGNGNSTYFGDLIKEYDAVIIYCNNGKFWTYSVYSDESKDFDCAEFVKQFNGGGHKKAAGFTMTKLPAWIKYTY